MSDPRALAAGFLPVLAFLGALHVMDSYKLVHRRLLGLALGGGVLAAAAAVLVNRLFLESGMVDLDHLRLWAAPVSEELLKAVLVGWLIRTDRVGFVVDAAVVAFAVGAGFALTENVYYANALGNAPLALWLVRGFGTAVMHGSTTALFGILGKALTDRSAAAGPLALLPGLLVAMAVHAAFNHLVASPYLTTAALLVGMPLLLLLAFEYSERTTRDWLASGFDGEMEMLEQILDGDVADTPVGRYLDTLRHRFDPLVVADLFCLLTVHLELSLRAKGMLLARAAGVEVPVDDQVRANLVEMRHLERTVGATGCLAILPLRRQSRRDLWQILLLERGRT